MWLRCLDSELTEKSLYEGLERSYAQHKNEERYSAPMNAIVWSNYERKGESGIMCEALYDLFADELEERMERGKAEGRAEGKAEGMREIILNMKSSGMSVESISDITKLSIEKIEQLLGDS